MSAEAAPPRAGDAVPVAGILLAAGTSSRMGSNKMLLQLDGESVLRRAVRQALGGGLAPLLVVLGHESQSARRELLGCACQVVVNPNYQHGITTSLQAGVAALARSAPTVGAAVVMLADMPFVTGAMVADLVARYRDSGAALVISDYEGVNAPPTLYDRSLFHEILSMTSAKGGAGCGKQVVKRHRGTAVVLHWPVTALADLDLPADLERLRHTAPSLAPAPGPPTVPAVPLPVLAGPPSTARGDTEPSEP